MKFKKKIAMNRSMDEAEKVMLIVQLKNNDVIVLPDNVKFSDAVIMLDMAFLGLKQESIFIEAKELIKVKK